MHIFLQIRPKFYLLFTPTWLSLNQMKLKALLSVTPSNVGSFQLKLYICEKLWSHYLNKVWVKHCILKIAFSTLSRWQYCFLCKKS